MAASRPKFPMDIVENKTLDHDTKVDRVCVEYVQQRLLATKTCIKGNKPDSESKCKCLFLHCQLPSATSAEYAAETAVTRITRTLNKPMTRRIAEFLVLFFQESKDARNAKLLSWIQYASLLQEATKARARQFILPQHGRVEPDAQGRSMAKVLICNAAFLSIFGIGQARWKTLREASDVNEVPKHGLVGRQSNKRLKGDITISLNEFFENLKRLANSKVVETGTTEAAQEVYELPADLSRRRLYKQWCLELGQKVTFDKVGNATVEQLRGDAEDICSWNTFTKFWYARFPELVIIQKE